jgi:hypothetical protein
VRPTSTRHPQPIAPCSPARYGSWVPKSYGGESPQQMTFFLWLVLDGRNWTLERAWHHDLHDALRALRSGSGNNGPPIDQLPRPYARGLVQSPASLRMARARATASGCPRRLVATRSHEDLEAKAQGFRVVYYPLCLEHLTGAQRESFLDSHESSPAVMLSALWALCDLWCRAGFISWSCLSPDIVA